jgi:hypothetical protein
VQTQLHKKMLTLNVSNRIIMKITVWLIPTRQRFDNCLLKKFNYIRGDQERLFKLVILDRILNRITGVTSGCWWLVVVNAIPISDICKINQQNISSCSVINNRS